MSALSRQLQPLGPRARCAAKAAFHALGGRSADRGVLQRSALLRRWAPPGPNPAARLKELRERLPTLVDLKTWFALLEDRGLEAGSFFFPRSVHRIVRPRGSWGPNPLHPRGCAPEMQNQAHNRAGVVGSGTRERARTTAKQPTIGECEVVYVEVHGFNFTIVSVDW